MEKQSGKRKRIIQTAICIIPGHKLMRSIMTLLLCRFDLEKKLKELKKEKIDSIRGE